MDKKVLIVSASETFTVRGLEMKLKAIGVETVFAAPQIKEINNIIEDISLIILYTDDTVEDNAETLVYLKDSCVGKDRKVIVIGQESEYRIVLEYIPEEIIYRFFDRPLKMEDFLDSVDGYLDEAAEYARRKSILIVDDDVTYMTVIRDWLKDIYHVSMTASGMQAITWLANNHADLILLDYEMPITSGPQVLEMIKSEPQTSDIPVMFLTGKNDRASIMKVLDLKPADYLLKTIDRAGLRDKLEKFFLLHG
ncbi:MAG: response regulator [Lachnospiraceae bacterium]|nr:response regulator [Lachnospiraceae bacterium]